MLPPPTFSLALQWPPHFFHSRIATALFPRLLHHCFEQRVSLRHTGLVKDLAVIYSTYSVYHFLKGVEKLQMLQISTFRKKANIEQGEVN